MSGELVAIVGTRFDDLSVENEILQPLGVQLRAGAGRNSEELLQVAKGAAVILAGASPRFDSDTIRKLCTRGIVRYGVGTDTIDLEAARAADMWVARVPDYGAESVALHAITLVMAALRRLCQADALVKSGGWDFAPFRPLHLASQMRAGVFGFGQIGRQAARFLSGLGFDVAATDLDPAARNAGVPILDPDELLERSDVLTLHVPARDDGRPVIGVRELTLLPRGAIVINTSRGSVLDTRALVEALRSGQIGYAALDVFRQEPPSLKQFAGVLDRVTLTPHMAWYTTESERELRVKAAQAVSLILRDKMPAYPVVVPQRLK